MNDETVVLTAAWAAPMDAPLIRDAAVAFRYGRIVSVGAAKEILSRHGDARIEDLGDSIILPGLINAHTHLELSVCSNEPKHDCFGDWILSLTERLGRDRLSAEEVFPAATRAGIAQCLRFGVTTVGDISQRPYLTRPVLAQSVLRAVSYGEVLGLAKLKPRSEWLLQCALDRSYEAWKLRIGLTPHAPYTVDLPTYQQCLQIAREQNLPLATHLSETPAEELFLRDQTGEFREIFERLGAWSEPVETFRGSPIEFAHAIGLLDYPTLLAHVNYCSDTELELLSRGRASVVYCPRTHRYFGHPPHRWREMLARGVNVAVATDSCASSPDLNIVDDLRLTHEIAPDFAVNALWSMVSTRAAEALQLHAHIGSLRTGKAADFTVFATRGEDPLRDVLKHAALPTQVWIDGQRVEAQ